MSLSASFGESAHGEPETNKRGTRRQAHPMAHVVAQTLVCIFYATHTSVYGIQSGV